jgi:DNA (cytosine-5)-methyltransferase 1
MVRKPTYIDLFSGAGGFSLGFEKNGFQHLFSIDIEPSFCSTYKANFPEHRLIEGNITELSSDEILEMLNGESVDVVVGGPPCQGFSIAGNIGRKFIEDSRNQLFKEFARVVSVAKPKYFVMENVARLYTHNQGNTRNEIIKLFNNMGYTVECKILNAANFGVAQVRNRVIFIGSRVSKNIFFPEKTVDTYKTVKDAIHYFPVLNSGDTSLVPNHIAMKHSEQMLAKMSFVSDGGDRNEIPEKIRPLTGDVRKYIRYKSDEPSVCVTGDMRKIFHYDQNRALTVRELAKIQSFPDDFVFKGSTISQQQQVGNSVPPLLASEIAKAILNMFQNDQ